MVFLSSFESVVSKLEKRSKNRASKKLVFDTRATAKERITRISSNNYNFLILNLNVFRLDKNCTKKRNNCIIKKYFFILVRSFKGWERSFKNSYFYFEG